MLLLAIVLWHRVAGQITSRLRPLSTCSKPSGTSFSRREAYHLVLWRSWRCLLKGLRGDRHRDFLSSGLIAADLVVVSSFLLDPHPSPP